MNLLAPGFLLLAGGLAAAVVVLHLLARRPLKPQALPTARFVPEADVRAPAMAVRPTDRGLMIFRIVLVMLAGLAFSRPVLSPTRNLGRVIVVDRSRSVQSAAAGLDSAANYFEEGDAIVVFTGDSVRLLTSIEEVRTDGGAEPGNLTAALLGALRAARSVDADSLELVIVSAFVDEEWDVAVAKTRAQWKGRARLVTLDPAPRFPTGVTLRSTPDDPMVATVALLNADTESEGARIVRGIPDAADSAWVMAGGGVLVHWPVDPIEMRTGPADTVGGVVAWNAVTIAPFARTRRPPDGRAVAHWVDGVPAAVQRPLGAGCERTVAIDIPAGGDLVLRAGWQRFVAHLASPCGGPQRTGTLSEEQRSILAGRGSLMLNGGSSGPERTTPANTWLLLLALGMFLAEPLIRRRGAT